MNLKMTLKSSSGKSVRDGRDGRDGNP